MASNPFVGAWRLVSMERRASDGQIDYPLGREGRGYIVYSEDGYVSAQLAAEGRPRFASADQLLGTIAEKVRAAETYVAYCGRYEIRQDRIVHHVEMSFFPNWVGVDLERFFGFEGDRLVLATPPVLEDGATVTYRLVWERARGDSLGESMDKASVQRASMAAEENKAISRRFDELIKERRLDDLREVLDASYVYRTPGSPDLHGPEALGEMLRGVYAALPDLDFEFEDMAAEGNRVVVRYLGRGTHQGVLMGVPPTGKQVTLEGIVIRRIAGSKIVESWEVVDRLGLLQQIGAVSSAEGGVSR